MKVRPSALILNGESILTLRYCYGNINVYALPGGNPDPGESLTEALARELNEELDIHAEIDEMILCGEVLWNELKTETLHTVFKARISSGTPQLNAIHTTALELVWLPFSVLADTLLYPNLGPYILTYLNGKSESTHVGVINQPYIQ